MKLLNGVSCAHKGCLGHVTHPCESCGRIGGYPIKPYNVSVPIQDIYNLEKARLELIRRLEAAGALNMATMTSITNPMWVITHKKYKRTVITV